MMRKVTITKNGRAVEVPAKSSLLAINWFDAFKGLLVAVLSAVVSALYEVFTNSTQESINWKHIGGIAAAAALGYLLKQFFTNENGEPLKSDVK